MARTIIRELDVLHPKARQSFVRLRELLIVAFRDKKTASQFLPFETYRPPHHQVLLVKEGVSKAKPWSSAHQYGLAVDFVAKRDNKWSWGADEDWDYLNRAAITAGLRVPYDWDRVHVEHPSFEQIRKHLL